MVSFFVVKTLEGRFPVFVAQIEKIKISLDKKKIATKTRNNTEKF